MSSNRGLTFKPEPLTEAEAAALVAAIRGNGLVAVRSRALVSMLWRSGLRVSELLSLKPSDVDLDAGTVRVLRGKGDRERVAAIDYRCIDHVRYWMVVREGLPGVNGRQRLFCSVGTGAKRKAGQPIHPSYVRRLLPKLAEEAGIEKRVHPHGLRHTYSNELLDRGVPLQHISQTLGHQHVSTTDTYLRKLNPIDTVAAIRAAGLTVQKP